MCEQMIRKYFCALILITFLPIRSIAAGEDTTGEVPGNSLFQFNAKWKDHLGRPFIFRDLRGHPAVVSMFYSGCTSTCPLTVENMQRLFHYLEGQKVKDTNFVLVSFDPEGDDPVTLARFAKKHGIKGPQWHLLHGSQDEIEELAVLLGVKFKRNDDGSYAHSNVLILLNADGVPTFRHEGVQLPEERLKEFLARGQEAR